MSARQDFIFGGLNRCRGMKCGDRVEFQQVVVLHRHRPTEYTWIPGVLMDRLHPDFLRVRLDTGATIINFNDPKRVRRAHGLERTG